MYRSLYIWLMARPIEYDMAKVLKSGRSVFWKKGFASTGMRDLEKATALSTRSFYNLFKSKNGFFKAVLDDYHTEFLSQAKAAMKKGRGIPAIHSFFAVLGTNQLQNGCLFINTLNEIHLIDSKNSATVNRHFNGLESLFAQKLQEAVDDGFYSGDPEVNAAMIVVFIQGVTNYSKHNPEKVGALFDDFFKRMELV